MKLVDDFYNATFFDIYMVQPPAVFFSIEQSLGIAYSRTLLNIKKEIEKGIKKGGETWLCNMYNSI